LRNQNKPLNHYLKQMTNWKYFTLIVALLLLLGNTNSPLPEVAEKINGVSLVGSVHEVGSDAMLPIMYVNANWVCLLPYGYGAKDETDLKYNIGWQWWGERKIGVVKCVQYAKKMGLKVMLKPQIWFRHGFYVGQYNAKTEKDWVAWEQNYENFILDFAHLADSLDVDMFCIGTEFTKFVAERPAFWNQLIDKVRAVYKGKITYAANWDAYQRFPHWEKLDYIGIDAYFPLVKSKTPLTPDLVKAWEKYHREIEILYKTTKIPVIFTEFGYRSVNNTADRPWESNTDGATNHQGQQNAYEAIFQKFWCEEWFAGGFIWNWYNHHSQAGGNDTDYTPQNKPAQTVIKEWYQRY